MNDGKALGSDVLLHLGACQDARTWLRAPAFYGLDRGHKVVERLDMRGQPYQYFLCSWQTAPSIASARDFTFPSPERLAAYKRG